MERILSWEIHYHGAKCLVIMTNTDWNANDVMINFATWNKTQYCTDKEIHRKIVLTGMFWFGRLFISDTQQYNEQHQRNEQFKH